MPIYTYRCEDCQTEFEEFWLSFAEVTEHEQEYLEKAPCPKCKSTKKTKMMAPSMVTFKGDGWTNKTISGSTRKDSTGSLRERAAEIKDQAKKLTSEDLYGKVDI